MSNDNIDLAAIDLDNLDLSTVETGFPLLPDGIVEVSVSEVSIKPNKAGTGQNLTIKLVTTQPMTDLNGKAINPGFPVFDLISLTPTAKYDPRPKLAEFKESATGSKTGSFNPPEQYLGAVLTVRLKVERSSEFGDKNRIVRYIKKG